jgi:cyclophilin family peptidyl-prolyl cis-trans isomerase
MSSRKTRDRQLAKLAARRQAERRRRRRQRIVAGVVALALAAGGGTGLYLAFTGGGKVKNRAGGTPRLTTAAGACETKAPPAAGKPKPHFKRPPPLTIDKNATYIATMKTSCGSMRIRLLPQQAPETVNSFVFLAQHHYFDGQRFQRIADSIDVIQGGDPTGTGRGGPGYTIPDEVPPSPSYGPGTLAMANTGQPHTGGSQFVIITGPKGHGLDNCNQPGQTCYSIFGHITDGLAVAQRIQGLPVKGFQPGDPSADGPPTQPVYLEKVVIKETGANG